MELKTYKRASCTKWEGTGKWKLEQKKKGSGNWVIRERKWNRKLGTARWDEVEKEAGREEGAKGVEAGEKFI